MPVQKTRDVMKAVAMMDSNRAYLLFGTGASIRCALCRASKEHDFRCTLVCKASGKSCRFP